MANELLPKFYEKLSNLENEEINKKFNYLVFINFYSKILPVEDINNLQGYMDNMYIHN